MGTLRSRLLSTEPDELASLERSFSEAEDPSHEDMMVVQEVLGRPRSIGDATPRSLYVRRDLLNADKLIAWAGEQGFKSTLPARDMHVTLIYSKTALDWMKIQGESWGQDEQGRLRVPPGGVRLVEQLGDKGAVCLLFTSSSLTWRHEELKRAGAQSDFEDYQPHVTITYQRGSVDPALVEPYQGELLFGPEVFEEIREGYTPGEEEPT